MNTNPPKVLRTLLAVTVAAGTLFLAVSVRLHVQTDDSGSTHTPLKQPIRSMGTVSPRESAPVEVAYPASALAEKEQKTFSEFKEWAARYASANSARQQALIEQGKSLAIARREALLTLIKNDPEKALAAALPVAVRNQLPAEVQPLLEERVSQRGDLLAIAVTPAPNQPVTKAVMHVADFGTQYYYAHTYGKRQALTVRKTGIHGIAIGNQLAVLDRALRVVEPGEDLSKKRASNVCPISKKKTYIPLSAIASDNLIAVDDGEEISTICSPEHIDTYEQQFAAQGGEVAGDSGPGTSNITQRPDLSWTHGDKRVLVIRVDFSDLPGTPSYNSELITDQYVYDCFHGSDGVSQFFQENSFYKTNVILAPPVNGDSPDVTQVLRLPRTAHSYVASGDYWDMHLDASNAAATAGVNLNAYDRHLLVFSHLNFPWGGLGSMSGKQAWINGLFSPDIVIHELGHTYGVYHSNLWRVPDGNPVSANGRSQEYGDLYDIMGWGGVPHGHLSHWQKSILRWIPDTAIKTVSSAGTYRIHRFDHGSANLNHTLGVKIVRNATNDYWIGYRRNTSDQSLQNGAYVLWGYNVFRQGDLLDMTQTGYPGTAPGLLLNQGFHDAATNIWFKPVAQGGTGADEWLDVQVSFNGPPGGTPPTASFLSPAPGWQFRIGQPITFTAAANDAEEGTLPPSAFSWNIERHEYGGFRTTVYTASGITTVNYVVPDDASYDTTFVGVLTVTDSTSSQTPTTITRTVTPMVVPVSISTNRDDILVNIEGTNHMLGEVSLQRIVGMQMPVIPSEGSLSAEGFHRWVGWAHGGPRIQTLTVTEGSNAYTILYELEDNRYVNFNFDWYSVGVGQFQYSPQNMGWSFVNGAGIAANNSAFTSSNPPAPQGTQVAFLQSTGRMTQTINALTPDTPYKLTFQSAQRAFGNSAQTWRVLLDGVTLATYSQTSTDYVLNTINFVPADAGPFDLTFEGLNNQGDNTILIDDIRITSEAPKDNTHGLKAEYFNNTDLQGTPVLTRHETQINYNSAVAIPGVNTNFISIRWSGYITVPATGSYSFRTQTDDGVRLWIDGSQVINDWTLHAPTYNTGHAYLYRGKMILILMEFHQSYETGSAELMWSGPGSVNFQPIPATHLFAPHPDASGTGLKAEYFNNETLGGAPALVRTEAQVNYSDSQSIPGVNSDGISIRWSGEIQIPTNGDYTFYTYTDDGVRLRVNNVPMINDWTGHPPLENTATIYLSAGCYPIVMEFFEGWGGAIAQFSWSGPGIPKQLIPTNRLFPAPLDGGDPVDPNTDTDGDGMSDLAEAKFGSNPNDQNSRVLVSARTRSSGKIAVSFSCVVGNTYQLQSCNNLGPDAVWSTVTLDLGSGATGTSFQATTTTTQLTDNTASAALPNQRFYRVVAP